MDFNQYREAYAALGEEKYQHVRLEDDEIDEGDATPGEVAFYQTEEDKYFATRVDQHWSAVPGYMK
jgi:hypothetical protein